MRLFVTGLAAFALASSFSARAQEAAHYTPLETRIGEAGFESPPATLGQMDWLVGQWVGEGIGGAPAMESWLPPSGDTMVGTFVQTKHGEDGAEAIMFTEHMYLMEENGSLVLRLKHFDADLTGWEEKGGMLTFRLVSIEPCAAYFNALTLRCANPDRPGEGLVSAVRMKSDKPEVQELRFRFDRAQGSDKPVRCANAMTTVEMNECFSEALAMADARRAGYFDAALERYADRPELLETMRKGENAFEAYREAECGAVLENWIDGSIRGAMTLGCRIDMTDQRAHRIWQNWLTSMDSSTPVLPEPQPTR